ncbi:hypothetical protein CQW23_24366 [Capsicum baccatum]|uniref:Uncharacterized protein n=1 Tax=Capsicum baccatum TaxID=33114 RepID=A0A2G2VUL7_CAPBA|nr:hypothetical protein CQW23_24366 [Capsicum baccatum]
MVGSSVSFPSRKVYLTTRRRRTIASKARTILNSLVCENPDTSTVEFIYDGQTKFQPIFHVFNRDLLLNDEFDYKKVKDESSENVDSSIRIPLKNLVLDTRKSTISSTSLEADELETIPPGTYCVWKPKINEPSPGKCKKSKSTGSMSKQWPRIRDLLRWCNSDGKDSIMFLTPKKAIENETGKAKNSNEVAKSAGHLKQKKGSAIGGANGSPAAALYYVQNRAGKEVSKNRGKSYLPYRKVLIGFFAVGLSRRYLHSKTMLD